jgi:hypothetical protein
MGRKRMDKHSKPVIEEVEAEIVDEKVYTLDTKSREIPEQCIECARKDVNLCTAYKKFLKTPCTSRTENYGKLVEEIDKIIEYNKLKGNVSQLGKLNSEKKRLLKHYNNQINKCYLEDKHRGSGGGGNKNEGGRQVKQLMNDNSAREVKERVKYEREYYQDALHEFEDKHGALPKLKPDDGITRSKVDSYTGEEIEQPVKDKKGKKK